MERVGGVAAAAIFQQHDDVAEFQILPGPRTERRRIQLTGTEQVSAARIEAYLKAYDPSNAAAWLDPDRLKLTILSLYRDEGMLAASVTIRPPQFTPGSAVLPVEIVEGPTFRIGAVRIDGASLVPDDEVRRAIGVGNAHEGFIGGVNRRQLQGTRRNHHRSRHPWLTSRLHLRPRR